MRQATKFILTLQTQYKENYGAHAWDGEGECPQYWKFKGGSEYVATTLSMNEVLDSAYVEQVAEDYSPYVSRDTDYDEEYVISWKIETEKDFLARHRREADEYSQMGICEYHMPLTVDEHLVTQEERNIE